MKIYPKNIYRRFSAKFRRFRRAGGIRPSADKIVIYTPELDYKAGGSIALHNLAKELRDQHCDARIFPFKEKKYPNEFCDKFARFKDIDAGTVVVYPEIIKGNPLNAKNVVRWILCDLGKNCAKDIYKSWGENDLVFHFSPFTGELGSHEIELLYVIWLHPKIRNENLPREGSCYLLKKSGKFHRKITPFHPDDAVLIDNLSLDDIIEVFKRKKYFYCYDPYTFYESIAALCGCVPIVYPIQGMDKLSWLKTKASFQQFIGRRNNVSGVAYGVDDIPYAMATLDSAWKEEGEIIEFGKKTVSNFIKIINAYFFGNKKDYKFKTVKSSFYD